MGDIGILNILFSNVSENPLPSHTMEYWSSRLESFVNARRLHQTLVGILGTSLNGCILVPDDIDPDALKPSVDWSGVPCNEYNEMDLLSGLNATEDVDALMLYATGIQISSYFYEAGGEPCKTASNVIECKTNLNLLNSSFDSNALVITQGDNIQVLQDESDVKSFLGDLDNPEKVFSWMHVRGVGISCQFENSAVISAEQGRSWNAVYTEMVQSCSPIVRERVRININVSSWDIVETARAEIERLEGACVGRKPPGILEFKPQEIRKNQNAVGSLLSRNAAFEAASVIAFEHLREELEFYDAPLSILKKIDAAIVDERRHAIQIAQLAHCYGQTADQFKVTKSVIRSLESIATDNMIEGCIGESWGALVGLHQAVTASDKSIAQVMQVIANEEIEHASLSWEIHAWLFPQLTSQEKERVVIAKQMALLELIKKAQQGTDQYVNQVMGLPEPKTATILAKKLVQSVMA